MSGLSLILETARRALMTQQAAISVTSHNISNASTEGYTRQRANLSATPALWERYGYVGTGVEVESITRLRDGYLDGQVRYSNSIESSATTQQNVLSQVEASFNEPSDAGLSSAMTAFFNSWQDLSTHPEDSSSRNAVIQQGTLLSQGFQRLHTELTQEYHSMNDDIAGTMSSINQLTSEISDLNTQIVAAQTTGAEPNDLEDARDSKLDDLSKLVNISVSTDTGGAASSTAIRALIKQLIGAEDTKSPLSDSRIAELLAEQGFVVARRTVAKYREALKIPAVNLRKSL